MKEKTSEFNQSLGIKKLKAARQIESIEGKGNHPNRSLVKINSLAFNKDKKEEEKEEERRRKRGGGGNYCEGYDRQLKNI